MRWLDYGKKYPPLPENFLEENRDRFKALGRALNLTLLYLHGSAARETMGPLSDIDIAVDFDPVLSNDTFSSRGELFAGLSDIFNRDDIDIAELRRASPLLRYLVVSRGQCVYARSEDDRVMFEFKAMRDYLDTIPLRHMIWEGLSSAIQSGKFYS